MQSLLLAMFSVAGSWIYIPGGSWHPDAKAMVNVRANLKAEVLHQADVKHEQLPPWASYSFQYQGRELKGRRVVYVNAFCSAPDYAEKQLVAVLDGGPCYFFAIYDVDSRTFAQVEFNGQG